MFYLFIFFYFPEESSRDRQDFGPSGASTPSLPRSLSTGSLYYEFGSAGVSPSPPQALKSHMSRNHSFIDSPRRINTPGAW